MWVWAPDEIKVEMSEDASMTVPIASHHIHYFVTAPLEIQAWYAKNFGAIPGKRAAFDAADLPAINLSFTKVDAALPGTKGRAVDHIGFEVKNLESFLKKLEAAGIKIDSPYRQLAELQHRDRVPHRSLGHLHRAHRESRSRKVSSRLP